MSQRAPVPGPAGGPTPDRGGAAPRRPGAHAQPREGSWLAVKRIFQEVDWSVSYLAFLLYFFVVTTYRVPLGVFAVAVAVAGLIIERGQRRFPYWLVWFLGFMLWGTAAYTQSPWSDIAWNEGVIQYGKLFLICVVGANVLTNRPRIRFFLIFFLVLYVSHPIRGALLNTFVYGYTEASRSVWNEAWSNPNDMAALTFLPLGIAAGLLKDRSDWVRRGALASLAIMPFVILLTRSRGGFLALGVFVTLTVLAKRKQLKGLLAIGLVAAATAALVPSGTFERFFDFTSSVSEGSVAEADDSSSAQQRLEIWDVARRIISDHPVFGVGLAAYPYAHGTYTFLSAETDIGGGRRDTHSTYLRLIAEVGYPGFFLFMTPFGLALARARRVRRRTEQRFPDRAENVKYVEAALWAYLVAGLFGSYAHLIFMWIHVGLLSLMTEDLRRTAARAARPAFARGPMPPVRVGPPRPVDAAR